MFDLIADVEKAYYKDGGYVYTLALTDNKTIKASPALGTQNNAPVKGAGNALTTANVAQADTNSQEQNSDTEQHSDRDCFRAVKRDDMASAARMVDNAANAA